MFFTKQLPSNTTIFSAYTSCVTFFMLFENIISRCTFLAKRYIPEKIRTYAISKFVGLCSMVTSDQFDFTLVIEEQEECRPNEMYKVAQTYLKTKIDPAANRLKVRKLPKYNSVLVTMEQGAPIMDNFEDIELRWKNVKKDKQADPNDYYHSKHCFELAFNIRYKERVLASYLPYVMDTADDIDKENKVPKLKRAGGDNKSINLDHPSTFDTLAMDPEKKMALIKDLDRFVERKEYYKRAGRAWKRGYLLYGPPGTGKSSLIAAMANYLKFDIYDMSLNDIKSDWSLRNTLLKTANKSILVIEDIDCCKMFQNNRIDAYRGYDSSDSDRDDKSSFFDRDSNSSDSVASRDTHSTVTLSGMLNFIDGLWSCCGDERIIVFTTNYKDRLDPALLRPGRMDMNIHMSYCTPLGFNTLASNYLGIQGHPMFEEIHNLLENIEVTPAEIAGWLMEYDDVDAALEGLVKFFQQKKFDKDAMKDRVKENNLHKRKQKKNKKKKKKKKATDDRKDYSGVEQLHNMFLVPTP